MSMYGLQQQAHEMAVGKGWWPEPRDAYGDLRLTHKDIVTRLALIHSEVSEAVEAVRDDGVDERIDHNFPNADGLGKPEGLPSELADIVIRTLDLAGALGINLRESIERKMAYNAGRTHRHGGRKL